MASVEFKVEDISCVAAWPEGDAQANVIFLGGWQQSFERMHDVQNALADRNIASVGFSAFDTIDPFAEPDVFLLSAQGEDKELLDGIPPRMFKRAVRLVKSVDTILASQESPFPHADAVITHCSGANVYLLARYLQAAEFIEGGELPGTGVLAEPMIAEGRRTLRVAGEFKNHEEAAKSDSSLISLQDLQGSSPNTADGFAMAKPLSDILNSRGVSLFTANIERGEKLRVVVGRNDVAAPDILLAEQFGRRLVLDPVIAYGNQRRSGHGYLLDEPVKATEKVAKVLTELCKA